MQATLPLPLISYTLQLQFLSSSSFSRRRRNLQLTKMSVDLKYENIHNDDIEDSSTEVDESLMGDDKHLNRYRKSSKRRSIWSILNQARWFLDTLLLLVIVGLLMRGQSRRGVPTTSEHEIGGDITGVGPHREF